MQRLSMYLVVSVLAALMAVQVASAVPILNPANGHYYELVPGAFTLNWEESRDAAEQMTLMGVNGHLATITSQSENDFINTALSAFSTVGSAFIGGFQDTSDPAYSEPGGGWGWITGVEFIYTNWGQFEPNNALVGTTNENSIEFLFGLGDWNDLSSTDFLHPDFVVEYDVSTRPVPEPTTFLLLCGGFIAIFGYRTRFK